MPRPSVVRNSAVARSAATRPGLPARSRPGAVDVARHLGLVVHDLRGPATALQAYARFLDEQARPALDASAAGWLDAFQANAELTGHLCEALCILEGASLRSGGGIREIVAQSGARLQKLLARAPIALKLSGDFPDRRSERRRLGFVVDAVLVTAAAESGAGRPGCLDWSAREREERIVLQVQFDAGLFGGLSELPARLDAGRPAGLTELALEAALSDLGAEMSSPSAGVLELSLPAGGEVTWP